MFLSSGAFSVNTWRGDKACPEQREGAKARALRYNTATNRISQISGSSTGITYDAAGNTTQDWTGYATRGYTWDAGAA